MIAQRIRRVKNVYIYLTPAFLITCTTKILYILTGMYRSRLLYQCKTVEL